MTKVREEARAWVVRLKDAHSAGDRAAFERWLSQSPDHRIAYDQILESYEASSVLRASEIGRRRDLESAFPERRPVLARGFAAVSIAGLLLLGALELNHGLGGLRPVRLESVMLSSGVRSRSVTLADGSMVNLAAQSEVLINLGRSERVAKVRKGRVHFNVAHDNRPFRIVAGASEVKAHDGSFDAVLVAGQGSVARSQVNLSEDGADHQPPSAAGGASASGHPEVMEFSAEPLGSVIDRINRANIGPRLELDPNLSDLRVTALFQQGKSEDIARSIAVAFGLKLTRTPSGTLMLTRETN